MYQCNKSFESSELKKGMINSFVRFVCGYTTGLLYESFETRILCKLYFWAVVVAMFVCRSMQGWLAACSVLFSVLSDSVLKWQNHVTTKNCQIKSWIGLNVILNFKKSLLILAPLKFGSISVVKLLSISEWYVTKPLAMAMPGWLA